MSYRLDYTFRLSWQGPGGPMSGGVLSPLPGPAGNRMMGFTAQAAPSVQGSGTSGALQAGDIATLTTPMVTDITAQITAQLNRLAFWPL